MTITRMTTMATMMAAMTAWVAPVASQASQARKKLTVYVQNKANVPNQIRIPAQAMASRMFAEIGISLGWSAAKPVRSSDEPLIVVDLVAGTPENRMPGALAYALPYEGVHVSVFFDRVARGQAPAALLAHVMAHEITHLLQGISRHSVGGVMKARWTVSDLCDMQTRPLAFAAEDVYLIYRGLLPRPDGTGTLLARR